MIKRIIAPIMLLSSIILMMGCSTLPPKETTIEVVKNRQTINASESDIDVDFALVDLDKNRQPLKAKVTGNVKVTDKEDALVGAVLDFDLGFIKSNVEYYVTKDSIIMKSQFDNKYKIKRLDNLDDQTFKSLTDKLKKKKDLFVKVTTDWLNKLPKDSYKESDKKLKLIVDNDLKELRAITVNFTLKDLKNLVDAYITLLRDAEIKDLVFEEIKDKQKMTKEEFDKKYNEKLDELVQTIDKAYKKAEKLIKSESISVTYGVDDNNTIWHENYKLSFLIEERKRKSQLDLNIKAKYIKFNDKVKLILPVLTKENSMITR